ncbi:hypothetical protein FisN_28Lu081 [Fistulifera solaris]|jgi:hypothetical protein|uniref:DUF6604 domain-containing protein n=1 Tax=Fistulifera solaris TaxID=1519565 RepID=A0A1Z5KSE6_FISSO|nr:hypothetical protein FisN_28Lu081 [Fistulifera solaris]|eukprot:GAX29226.1 hypothetical protein FisN_28Lu081 [Fistulifera solaris]
MPNNKGRHKKRKAKQPNPPPVPQLFQRLKSVLPAKTISPAPKSDGGYHAQYKEATLSFHNWMANKACPALRMTAVDDYRRGVGFIVEHNMKLYLQNEEEAQNWRVAPPDILASLVVSIRLREKVAAKLFGSKKGGDLGHQYIIDVLKYCQSSLCFANRIAAVHKASKEEDSGPEANCGRFRVLSIDVEDPQEEIDWVDMDRDIQQGNVPKYNGVKAEKAIDIKEAILKGDDRFQAIALLETMEDLMEIVHN